MTKSYVMRNSISAMQFVEKIKGCAFRYHMRFMKKRIVVGKLRRKNDRQFNGNTHIYGFPRDAPLSCVRIQPSDERSPDVDRLIVREQKLHCAIAPHQRDATRRSRIPPAYGYEKLFLPANPFVVFAVENAVHRVIFERGATRIVSAMLTRGSLHGGLHRNTGLLGRSVYSTCTSQR